ncbi:MAG: hypothetical protein ABFC89_01440 [Methanospirillum sp.]
MSPDAPDPSLPARLRELHARLPLAGDRPNALLSLPDDRILFLAAVLRDTPKAAPALAPEEVGEFLDLLPPHGIYAPRGPARRVAGRRRSDESYKAL